MTAHVPAWKRLGLQLKNVSAESEEPLLTQPPPKRRKLRAYRQSRDDTVVTTDKVSEPAEGGSAAVHATQTSLGLRDQTAQKTLTKGESNGDIVEKHDPGSSRKKNRKSVTFDADTKAGHASVSLADSGARREDAAEVTPEVSAELPQTGEREDKKKKQKRKPKADGTVQSEPQPAPAAAENAPAPRKPKYLAYLDAHSHDRANWKFNSNHQKKLLENAFDLHRVPPSYDEALVDYVKGLQGGQARIRLREEANGLLTNAADKAAGDPQEAADGSTGGATDASDLDEMAKHRRARAKALVGVLQSRGSLTDHERQARSEAVRSLKPPSLQLNEALQGEPAMSREPAAGDVRPKKKRTRKRRSASDMPDEDTILSDSSV